MAVRCLKERSSLCRRASQFDGVSARKDEEAEETEPEFTEVREEELESAPGTTSVRPSFIFPGTRRPAPGAAVRTRD